MLTEGIAPIGSMSTHLMLLHHIQTS